MKLREIADSIKKEGILIANQKFDLKFPSGSYLEKKDWFVSIKKGQKIPYIIEKNNITLDIDGKGNENVKISLELFNKYKKYFN